MRLLISLMLFLVASFPAFATTYYSRDGGGSVYGTSQATNTCNGTANVVYSFGASPNCAVNHPVWIMGAIGDNGQDKSAVWAGGDVLSIDGDSDVTPGTQAVYNIGYGMPNTTNGTCNTGFEYQCQLRGMPVGTLENPTSIIGTGTHRPMFLSIGTIGPHIMIDAENNYLTIQNLEMNGAGDNGYFGIELHGTGLTLTDVYIHGFANGGIDGPGAFGDATFTRLWIIGNLLEGFNVGSGGGTANTGTLTFNQPIIEWNGCVETYPVTGGIDNPSNYTGCKGQGDGGYGDGLAFGASGGEAAGNWTIIGPGSISFNVQDGLDILHGISGTGTDNIDKMRFEGNGGQQIKITGLTDNITNNIIIGDCGWWSGSAQAGTHMTPNGGDACRANGAVIRFAVAKNITANFLNNTIITNAIALEANGGSDCDGSTVVTYKNNIIQGGYTWNDDSNFISGGGDSLTTAYYNDGSNGDGAGPCGTITPVEDYNLIYGNKNSNFVCAGAHDKCGTTPNFTPTALFPAGTFQGPLSSFYQGLSGITLVAIPSGSAAKGAGVTGLTYWNNSNDYYNVTRSNPPSIGGLEQPSSAANGYLCFFNSDCTSNTCTANLCSAGVAAVVNSSLTANDKIIGIVD